MREIFRRLGTTLGIITWLVLVAYVFDWALIKALIYWFSQN